MKPYLRDGVDVYIEDLPKEDLCAIIFVFLSTRKRIQIHAKKIFLNALPLLDGNRTIQEISLEANIEIQDLEKFVHYLELKNVVTTQNWYETLDLEAGYKNLVQKQLFFMMDVLQSSDEVCDIQKKIKSTRVGIFGLGSTGSWVFVELLQMGFECFSLYDYKKICKDSITRHAFFSEIHVEKAKIDFYQSIAKKINPNATAVAKEISINTDTEIGDELKHLDIIINCADEPYVGYTSIFLSRYCVALKKILFVTGGFDAHLGCLGEMIIPHKTPCSDCYNTYFKKSLKDWKPVTHPVKNRIKGFGGLAPLSVFSASTATLAILRYFLNEKEFLESAGGRGEFKFDDYSIDSFEVKRDTNCGVCGDYR